MTKLNLFGAVLIVSAAVATPALAGGIQVAEVIQEPGLYAFYHPMGDLGIAASSRPAEAMAQSLGGGEVAGMRMSVRRHATRHFARVKHY
jgi:hypothetical protein